MTLEQWKDELEVALADTQWQLFTSTCPDLVICIADVRHRKTGAIKSLTLSSAAFTTPMARRLEIARRLGLRAISRSPKKQRRAVG